MAGGQETVDYASKRSICAAGLVAEDLLASTVPAAVFQEPGGHLSNSSHQLQKEPELFAWSHTAERVAVQCREPPGLLESRGRSKGQANELCQAIRLS